MGKLVPLEFKPGIDRDGTNYNNDFGWYDCDFVRFRGNLPEKIGGWQKVITSAFQGICRTMHHWQDLSNDPVTGLGTHLKYYLADGGVYVDITPIRLTASLGTDPFTTTSSSTEISVAHTSHGATMNDFVTFSGATGGNGIAAGTLNAEHQITEITDGDNYKIVVSETASGSGAIGGASVTAAYQINVGSGDAIFGNGFGAGAWGDDGWGDPSDTTIVSNFLRLWSADHFGEDLIINARDSAIYYYDRTTPTTRAVELSTLSGASDTPTIAREVLVSDNDRHVIAFGTNEAGSAVQDRALIRWSDAENAADWTPTNINSAGSLRFSHGSEFTTAMEARGEILIWTDRGLNSMQFLGPPFIFGINLISSSTTIISPGAKASLNDVVAWMGKDQFYIYDGRVIPLDCTVRDYVFSDINNEQNQKIVAGTNVTFNEFIWFYPSANSLEIDRCVAYSLTNNSWYIGSLARTCWIDQETDRYPRATDTSGFLYHHEIGCDDGSTDPVSGISAYIESSPFEMGDGDSFMFVNRILPDIDFRDSTAASPSVTYTVTPRDYPGVALGTADTGAVARTATTPVDQWTKKADIRVRGRSLILKVDSSGTEVGWRLGTTRLEMRPDGRK